MASNSSATYGMEFSPRAARILLVDDEMADLKNLRLILEGQGFEVFTCTDYGTGIQCLEAERFDFVVVSQGTQAFEGRVVLDHAMRLDRGRPVLVVTRCIDMQCYLEAMQLGAIDYLEKPIPPAELLRFVRAHVAGRDNRSRQTAV